MILSNIDDSSRFFSKAYEDAESKSHLVLLKYKARIILEYEALGNFHESDPKYIYYISKDQNFEEWYKRKEKDQYKSYEEWYKRKEKGQDTIYKDLEESTFTKQILKESDYDEVSIWKFDKKNEN